MNSDNNFKDTTGSVSRNTFYNMEAPEWRCENCGRFNHREAKFCRSCGAHGPVMTASTPATNNFYVAEMPQKKSSAGKWIAIVASIVIVVAAITFVVIKFVLSEDDQSSTVTTNNQSEAPADTTDSYTESGDEVILNQEQDDYASQETTPNSYYTIGGTYYVQPEDGVNVRVGPGTNYDVVINQKTGKKVALRKGTAVECEGMSDDGNWMMISSGWICVWDGNETLVR